MRLLKLISNFRLQRGVRRVSQHTAFMDSTFLYVEGITHRCRYELSPNQKWVVSWDDTALMDDGSLRSGQRDSGYGRYILCHGNRVAFVGSLERPNFASVANNGVFSVEDWRFGDNILGSFHVFDADGTTIINKSFNANLISSAVSANGLLAICQTANSSGLEGNSLVAFDLTTQEKLFSITPETPWDMRYVFDEENRRFGVFIKSLGSRP